MNQVDIFSRLAVKIESPHGGSGSGFIFSLKDKDYSYIFTAKHCIVGADHNGMLNKIKRQDIDISQIKISQQVGRKTWVTDFNIRDVLFIEPDDTNNEDQEIDIAIIVIDSILDRPIVKLARITEHISKEIHITGYPNMAGNLIAYLDIKGEFIRNTYELLELVIHPINGIPGSNKSYLEQMSGSGIFLTISDVPYICGVYTEARDTEVAYDQVFGECISQVNKILSTSIYKVVDIVENPHELQLEGKYTSLRDWGRTQKYDDTDWVKYDAELEDGKKRIQQHLLDNRKGNILYIVGRSGSGKSRLVYQSCVEKSNLYRVLYFENYKVFTREVQNILKGISYIIQIIIDEVSIDEWQLINSEFDKYTNIRIITIGVIYQANIQSRVGILVKKTPSKDQIQQVIKRRCRVESKMVSEYISNLSEGDLRLGLLIGAVVRTEEDIHSKDTSQISTSYIHLGNILDKILSQYEQQIGDKVLFLKLYSILCIAIDVGYRESFRNELDSLVKYFKLQPGSLDSIIEIAQKCDLGIDKGGVFEASPRGLAIYVFQQETWKLIKNNLCDFMDRLEPNLKKRFLERAEETKGQFREEVQKALASWFLSIFPSYDIDLLFDSSRSNIFYVYTDFMPEFGLRWLNTSINTATDEQIYSWSKDSVCSASPRRQVVWLCERLANFDEYFILCEEILFCLANRETEIYISNNSVGVWQDLFFIGTSNTKESYINRLDLLLDRLKNATKANIKLIWGAIINIFQDSRVRISPPITVGGKIVPENWQVSSEQQLYEIRSSFIKRVLLILKSLYDLGMCEIISLLIKNITDFIIYISEEIDILNLFNIDIYIQNSLLPSLVKYKKYMNHDDIVLNKLISSIEKNIEYALPSEKVTLYLYRDYWRLKNQYGEEEVAKIVDELAETVLKMANKRDELKIIFSDSQINNTMCIHLAQKIGHKDLNTILWGLVENNIGNTNMYGFILGYLSGCLRVNENIKSKINKMLDKDIKSYPEYIMNLTLRIDVSNDGLERILSCIDYSTTLDNNILAIADYEWNKFLSEDQKLRIMKSIEKNKKFSSIEYVLITLNCNWEHNTENLISDDRGQICLSLLERIISNGNEYPIWEFQQVLQHISNTFIEKKCDILSRALLNSHPHSQGMIIGEINNLASQNSTLMMKYIGNALEDDLYIHNPILIAYRGLFKCIKVGDVLDWIQEKGVERARLVARHLDSPLDKSGKVGSMSILTQTVLEMYGDDDIVYTQFIIGRHTWEVYTVEDRIKNHDRLVEDIKPYLQSNIKAIKKWAEYEINNSLDEIRDYKLQKLKDSRGMH